jgi:hypothetical protein
MKKYSLIRIPSYTQWIQKEIVITDFVKPFSSCLTFILLTACELGSFGVNCGESCTCIESNTDTCNADTGACTCKTGWTGGDCGTNIDECTDSANPHNCPVNSECVDTEGSFVCECADGFFKNSENKCEGNIY